MRRKCPRCGKYNVQLSEERSKHGCFWFIVFGIWFLIWKFAKCCVGFIVFLCYDWYAALIAKLRHKGHVWRCKKWFSGTKQLYYCHNCGYNFRE